MGDVVEVRDETVPVVSTGETFRLRDLRAEVAEDEHRWRVRSDQDGADEQLKLLHRSVGAKRTALAWAHAPYRNSTHFASSTSNSTMTMSVMSGMWWALQKPKYDALVRRIAPFVSSVAGWGNTPFHQLKKRAGQQLGDSGSSPAPWHADTGSKFVSY